MGFSMLAGPAAEPVPIAQMRDFLRLETEDDDLVLGFLTVAARMQVEALTGRLLMPQDWRLTLDAWPDSGVVKLPAAPASAIKEARVFDAAGAATTLPEGLLRLEGAGAPPRLLCRGAPAPGRAVAGIEVDITFGYADADAVPAPLKQAIRLLVAHWNEERVPLAPDPAPGSIPPAVRALAAPFRLVRLT